MKVNVDIDSENIRFLDIALLSPAPDMKQTFLWRNNCYDPSNIYSGLKATFDDDGSDRVCASPTTGNIKHSFPISTLYKKDYWGEWTLKKYTD